MANCYKIKNVNIPEYYQILRDENPYLSFWMQKHTNQWRIQDFLEGLRKPLRRSANILFDLFFSKNCMKMKKFLLRSATANLHFFRNCTNSRSFMKQHA